MNCPNCKSNNITSIKIKNKLTLPQYIVIFFILLIMFLFQTIGIIIGLILGIIVLNKMSTKQTIYTCLECNKKFKIDII